MTTVQNPASEAAAASAASSDSQKAVLPGLIAGGVVLTAAFVWAYWPTLCDLVATWRREPDYSHGFLVVPFAIYLLWARRGEFPAVARGSLWAGLLLVGMAIGLRTLGARLFLVPVDGWSILLWAAGIACMFGGWRVLRWSLPSIAFLWFMVPLPYRAERWVSLPLQATATKLSCWTLQLLGEPALARGNTILLGSHQLEVEQACSGLRIFVGIFALAFAYVILARRSWWGSILLLLSAVPIALVANSTRVVATGWLYRHVSSDAAQRFSHDICGWAMIPFAAALFGLLLWYSGKLFPEVELLDTRTMIRRGRE